jgi:ABC-2 type transport system ATP-binding protein
MNNPANNIIDVAGLSKSFDGKPAVLDVALQIKRGEIFGFLGPNGSGKTTTIRMLCGLLIPDAGQGHCLGYDILNDSHLIKLKVGYMTQRFSLYEDLTIVENLDFMARVYNIANRRKKITDCIAEIGLKDRQHQLAGTLSGGWKQRLALAAALLHGPQLLLLDEPTAGVDPKARRDFWDQIHKLSAQGITTLVSTHYMDEAERCHRLGFIAYGHLLTQGKMETIIQHARLVTWAVTCQYLAQLGEQLINLPGVEQVTTFGNTLHVSGSHPEKLQHCIQPYLNDQTYQWQQITPGLEDVFICLSDRAKETRYGD